MRCEPPPMAPVSRPYESLLAKGEDRRQHVLEVALRMMATGGGRATTLGQIARAAGVSTAGLLHHFSSKEQLLHAVLDARDTADEAIADLDGDLESQLRSVRRRFDRPAGMVGMFIVLMCENLDPNAPLNERFLRRYRTGLAMIATGIRRGQQSGRYRTDANPDVKAREVLAFLYGLEATWLLDPAVPVDEVFNGYTSGLLEELCAR
jgi:AcrR family transcriptional regulator